MPAQVFGAQPLIEPSPAPGTDGTGAMAHVAVGGVTAASAWPASMRPASDALGMAGFPADPSTATGRGYWGTEPAFPPVLLITWSSFPPVAEGPGVVGLPPLALTTGASEESTTCALHAGMSIATIANDAPRRNELRLELRTSFF